jgi:hypothetical protein
LNGRFRSGYNHKSMKTAPMLLILLAVAFASAQAFSWADCCCGSFCQHKNACTGCGPQDNCPGGESPHESKSSCCDQDESAPQKTCSHFEPSSEIDRGSADAVPMPPAVLLAPAPVVFTLPIPSEQTLPSIDTGPPRAGPGDSLPLHLFLSILRI